MAQDKTAELRQKVMELVETGLITMPEATIYRSKMLAILNEAERQRVNHEAAAQRLMEQHQRELGQAEGCSAMASAVLNMVNADLDRAKRELAQRNREDEESEERVDAAAMERAQTEAALTGEPEEAPATDLHKCPDCDEAFKTAAALRRHKKKEHPAE